MLVLWTILPGICQENPKDLAISVGNFHITKAQIFDEMTQKYPQEVQETIREMVVYWIIRQEATIENINIPQVMIQAKAKEEFRQFQEQIQQQTKQSWEQYLQKQGIQKKRLIQKLLRKWKYQLAMEQLVRLAEIRVKRIRVRHIMTDTHAKATAILQKLQQGIEFSQLVRQESLSESKMRGGELPILHPGDLEPNVDQVLFQLQVNEISQIVPSSWGYHIFQILEIYPERPEVSWAAVQTEITESLAKKLVTEKDLDWWLKKMSTKYPIQKHFQFAVEGSNP